MSKTSGPRAVGPGLDDRESCAADGPGGIRSAAGPRRSSRARPQAGGRHIPLRSPGSHAVPGTRRWPSRRAASSASPTSCADQALCQVRTEPSQHPGPGVKDPVPRRAAWAGTADVKKIPVCAPTPDRDASSPAGTFSARAALTYSARPPVPDRGSRRPATSSGHHRAGKKPICAWPDRGEP
jgi:hypothetical protein